MYIAAAVSFFSSASSAITANSANGQLTAGGRHSGVASLAHGAAATASLVVVPSHTQQQQQSSAQTALKSQQVVVIVDEDVV